MNLETECMKVLSENTLNPTQLGFALTLLEREIQHHGQSIR